MIKIFCDRCVKQINVPNPIMLYIGREIGDDDVRELILCDKCLKELNCFLIGKRSDNE